jgi:2-oxoglutarate ferredoxin oxidoreductase subunit beta
MSPCVTYNKINTFAWFKEHTYYVDSASYDPTSRAAAFDVLTETSRIPLGVMYEDARPTFETLTHLPERPIAHLDIASDGERLNAIQRAFA